MGAFALEWGLRLRRRDTFISTQIRYQNNTDTFIPMFTFYLLLTIKAQQSISIKPVIYR